MLGKTHAAVGTASALLIMGGAVAHHPVSLVTGATLGAIGGLVPDIDLNSKHAKAVGFSSVMLQSRLVILQLRLIMVQLRLMVLQSQLNLTFQQNSLKSQCSLLKS